MIKKIAVLTVFLFIAIQISFAQSTQMKGDIQSKRLNEGTILKLKLLDSLTTQDRQSGDPFSAILVSDIKSGNKIILPAGTVLRGNVSKVLPAKRLSKGAVIYLNFDHLVTTTGKQLPLRAGVYATHHLTLDGGITAGGNYGSAMAQSWDKTCEIVKTATSWGLNAGEGIWNAGGRILLTPIGAVGGTIGGAVYIVGDTFANIFRKGKNVILNKGEILEIMLLDPVDIPIA